LVLIALGIFLKGNNSCENGTNIFLSSPRPSDKFAQMQDSLDSIMASSSNGGLNALLSKVSRGEKITAADFQGIIREEQMQEERLPRQPNQNNNLG
jgi:hypothetical protein